MSQALEPTLTAYDLKVLRAIPACGQTELRGGLDDAATLWQIADALEEYDLQDLLLTVHGLQQFQYVLESTSKSRNRRVWWRTPKGDEAVG